MWRWQYKLSVLLTTKLSPEVELLRPGYMRGKGKLRKFVSTWNLVVHNVPETEEMRRRI